MTALADRIDALLPQTQCTRCGYPTCHAYATAIAQNEANIDRCPPGGEDGITALARLLGRAPKPLNSDFGIESAPIVALIDEDICIGCTKCIQACPVDAIVGAAKRMHTIIASECTGCELCLPPCPVDCIVLQPIADRPLDRMQILSQAAHARRRYDARNARLEQKRRRKRMSDCKPTSDKNPMESLAAEPDRTASEIFPARNPPARPIDRMAVLEAIARGKARRQAMSKDKPPE